VSQRLSIGMHDETLYTRFIVIS